MDIDYIKQLKRIPLMEYLLGQNFTTEAQILEIRFVDGEDFLTFTEQDLDQWGLNVNQKTLILNCRDKILRKSLISASSPKPNQKKEDFEQNKDLINFASDSESYKNTPKTQKCLPGPSKHINFDKSVDSVYDAPAAIPKPVPINPDLEKEKLELGHKILNTTKRENKNEKPNLLWSPLPSVPIEMDSGKSANSLYDVPAAISRPYVSTIEKKEQSQHPKTVNAALESSGKGEPNTLGSQRYFSDQPNKDYPNKSIKEQDEVPTAIAHSSVTIRQNLEKEQLKESIKTLQQIPLEKSQQTLSVVSKQNCSDKSVDSPDMSTRKPNVPTNPMDSFKHELLAVESNKKGKPNTIGRQKSLAGPAEISLDKSGNNPYINLPTEIPKSVLPINSKVEKEQLQEASKEGKPNTLGSPNILPIPPQKMLDDNSFDDEYQVASMMFRPSTQINTNLQKFKLKENISKTSEAFLQPEPHTLGSQRSIPGPSKEMFIDNSLNSQYELPKMIDNSSVPIHPNLHRDKLNEQISKILITSLQSNTKGQPQEVQKILPIPSKEMDINNSFGDGYEVPKTINNPINHNLQSQRPLPAPPKEFPTDNSFDDQYEVPETINNPINHNLQKEKLNKHFSKSLVASLQQGKPPTPGSQRPLPAPPKEFRTDNSFDDQYEVPKTINNPINHNLQKEKLNEHFSKSLVASLQQGKPPTSGSQRPLPAPPKEFRTDNSSDDQYEVPETINNPINHNLQKEKLNEHFSKSLVASLQQGKPPTSGSQRPLPAPPKEFRTDNSSDDQYEVPETINNPINHNLQKEKLNEHFSKSLVASLQQGKPPTSGSQRPLPAPPKEFRTDNSSDDQYEVPETINNPINHNLQKEKLNEHFSKSLVASLQQGKPPTPGSQRPLPAPPKEFCTDNNFDDQYEVPNMIPNLEKLNENNSKFPNAALKQNTVAKPQISEITDKNKINRRPLPAIPKPMYSQSLEFDNNQSLFYTNMGKQNGQIEDIENIDYVDMSSLSKVLNNANALTPKHSNQISEQELHLHPSNSAPKVPARPINFNLNRPGTSKDTTFTSIQSSSRNTAVQNPGVPSRFKLPQDQNVNNLGSPDRNRFPLSANRGAVRNQDIGKTRPWNPERQFANSDKDDNNYETPPCRQSKWPLGSIQDMPLPMPPSYHINTPREKTPISSLNTRNRTKNINDMLDLPHPPPELFKDPDYTNGQDKDRAWNLVDQTVLPRPPRLSPNEDPSTHLKVLFDDDSPVSSGDELFDPNDHIYYRNTDRKGARELLETVKNLKDNTFVLRPSTKDSYFLGLTIFHEGHYYNLGIYRDFHGKFHGQSTDEKETIKFNMVESLINYYKYNALVVKKRDGRIVELYLKHFLPTNIK